MGENGARPGYTRSGKSLKAVRRYYALKDASRKRKTPEHNEDEDDQRREERTMSRRRRSPDSDKLSKRIAAELRVQQEANEKRTRFQEPPSNSPTERSSLPSIARQRDTGPVFVAAPDKGEKVEKSAKSAKSSKSFKSVKSPREVIQIMEQQNPVHNFSASAVGCLVTCFVLALVYIITWVFMIMLSKWRKEPLSQAAINYSSIRSIRWLAITSILVIFVIPYWLFEKHQFRHAVVNLLLMVVSTISLLAHLVYMNMIEESPDSKRVHYLGDRNSLNILLPVTFLVFHLIAVSLMLKHLMSLISKQIEERSLGKGRESQQMSLFLAP